VSSSACFRGLTIHPQETRAVQHQLSNRRPACPELFPSEIASFCPDFLRQRETLQLNRPLLVINRLVTSLSVQDTNSTTYLLLGSNVVTVSPVSISTNLRTLTWRPRGVLAPLPQHSNHDAIKPNRLTNRPPTDHTRTHIPRIPAPAPYSTPSLVSQSRSNIQHTPYTTRQSREVRQETKVRNNHLSQVERSNR
jgi:hypothetical protein